MAESPRPPSNPEPLPLVEQDSAAATAPATTALAERPLTKAEQKAAQKAAKQAEKQAQKAEKQAQREAKQAEKRAQKERDRRSWVGRSLTLGLRLAGLGIAGGLAAIGGIALASFFAAPPAQETPLLERGLAGTSEGLSATQQLPKRLLRGLADRLDPPAQPQLEPAAPPLNDEQRQQLLGEASALRQELDLLTQRTDRVEQQLGYRYGGAALERRLAAIAQTLSDPIAGPQTLARPARRPEELVVTLPTDPLFEDAQSALKPGATALLANILSELRPYRRAIVTVSVHSDDVGNEASEREMTLRRAQVVANYLRSQLGEAPGNAPGNRFIWNPIGAGNAQPLVNNDSNENRQRNRRVEITVTPQ